VRGHLVVDYYMTKGVLGVSFLVLFSAWIAPHSSRAQEPDSFRLDNPGLFRNNSTMTLLNNVALNWTMPNDAAPPPVSAPRQNASISQRSHLSDRLTDSLPKFDYATGEIGFLYGRSTGKYGGEFKQGYIIGEVGNDKLQISAGAAYEDSSFRFPRKGR
jgi:hypothetical protein